MFLQYVVVGSQAHLQDEAIAKVTRMVNAVSLVNNELVAFSFSIHSVGI